MPSLEDARSLVEAAEFSANTIQEPLARAYAQLWIAVCWHRLQKPASYTRACDQLDKELFQVWQGLWRSRPPATTTISRAYYADQSAYLFKNDYRDQQEFTRRQQGILECYSLLAEAQAHAYAAIAHIDWPGGFCRKDIGWRAIQRESGLK